VGVVRALRVGWPRVVEKGQAASRWWKRRGGRDAELFCIAWIVPAWIVFELVSTKLPHYTMPMYPALALLSARAVMSAAKLLKNDRLARFGAMACVWIIPCVAGIGCIYLLSVFLSGFVHPLLIVGLALAAAIGGVAASATRRAAWLKAQMLVLTSAATLLVTLFAFLLPDFMPGAMTRHVIDMFNTKVPDWQHRPLATLYHEDSMIFWTRGRAQRINLEDIASWLQNNPSGLLVAQRRLAPTSEEDQQPTSGFTLRELCVLPWDGFFAGRPWFYLYEAESPT
jgi:4-amino-4-deoxy-L-arabinose transferase-like glycosyltransferase